MNKFDFGPDAVIYLQNGNVLTGKYHEDLFLIEEMSRGEYLSRTLDRHERNREYLVALQRKHVEAESRDMDKAFRNLAEYAEKEHGRPFYIPSHL